MKKVLILVMLVGLVSCKNRYLKDFDLVSENEKITPGTIAVVPGKMTMLSVNLAKEVTAELKRRSSLKVKSINYVMSKMPKDYNVVQAWGNPPGKEFKDNVAWISPVNKLRMDALAKKLNVKYVYLVWTSKLGITTVYSNNGTKRYYSYTAYGRFVKYPPKRVVGYTVQHYEITESSCWNPLNWGKTADDDINELITDTAVEIVDQMVKKTKTEKKTD